MILYIPYVEQPSLRVGPITIHAFGAIVATAVFVGLELGRRRFRRLRLDLAVGEGLAWYAVVGGFLGAHLFSVLFYFPEKVAQNPLVLFKLWEDISSFGSILGGLLGIWIYLHWRAPTVSASERWAYVDVAAFVFPFALGVGRIACSIAHDHSGTLTTFPLAVSLESQAARDYIIEVYRAAGRLAELPLMSTLASFGFHDLGWYEFLYLAVVVAPVVAVVARKPRPAPTFLALFIVLYTPVRFGLDFLRVSDARYAGLTPAQWVAVSMLLSLPVLWLSMQRRPPSGDAVQSPDECSVTEPIVARIRPEQQ